MKRYRVPLALTRVTEPEVVAVAVADVPFAPPLVLEGGKLDISAWLGTKVEGTYQPMDRITDM